MPARVSSSASPSLTPGQTTTWPCTSIPRRASTSSQRRLVAPLGLRSIEARRSGSVVWMETNNGPEALGQDPFGIELGESGQRGEVAVEERQPVVVVLEVEAAPHALGQLVDEAEGAVVVAGADAVEDGRGDLDPEGLAVRLVHPDQPGQGRAGAPHEDAEVVGVAEALEIDDVARLVTVEAQELVAHGQSGPGCRRRRGDRSHRGS